ncbi:LPXTG cell wall anchor domain-containing protein [Kitasatospora sp. NBC_01250]|uniref:LPXTG cell wall anchor domain-containing protein n=1 Tax=unclassified Kitasatospora TaxID=2633591 RepID=UPI002E1534F6|nr:MULTISPECIES: LPXTG cell wall anchor domain-containing protein [unclassified Kitasatospora]WSJ69807.1 LPXTG cell wall anchor domain-containing protein [Kitasatospora sp. NBC_01302]
MYKPCVGGAAAAAGTCELAATGSHTLLLTVLAVLMVLGGALLTRAARQRGGNA